MTYLTFSAPGFPDVTTFNDAHRFMFATLFICIYFCNSSTEGKQSNCNMGSVFFILHHRGKIKVFNSMNQVNIFIHYTFLHIIIYWDIYIYIILTYYRNSPL